MSNKRRSIYKDRDTELFVDPEHEALLTISLGNGFEEVTMPIYEWIRWYKVAGDVQTLFNDLDTLRLNVGLPAHLTELR